MIDLLTPILNFFILRQARRDEKEGERRRRKADAETRERLKHWEEEARQAQKRAEMAKVNACYESIGRERARTVPPGCMRDRYGTIYEVNPNGFGRRPLGSSPDEPYWVERDA